MAKSTAKKTATKQRPTPKAKAAPARPVSKAVAKSTTKSAAKSATKTPAKIEKKPIPAARAVVTPSAPPAFISKKEKRRSSSRHNGAAIAAMNAPLPLVPVATNGKPRKNQAGLNSRELEHFRDLLLAKRRELVGDMSSMEREALRSSGGSNLSNLPIHMADMGTDNYEQEFTLGLVEKDRNLLREINIALGKIQNGNFGICEATGKAITKARLEVQPWAKFSIEHARQLEKGRLR